MPPKKPPEALNLSGYLNTYRIKPLKRNAKNQVASPSTIVLTIEAKNEAGLLRSIGEISRKGLPIVFGLESTDPDQTDLDFAPE